VTTQRVLGVDDFSFCKRRTYGTILIDLERRVPIDLLPGREASSLENWLKAHPLGSRLSAVIVEAPMLMEPGKGHLMPNR
jgi:transposase